MSTTLTDRFRTDDICIRPGQYEFDGCADGSAEMPSDLVGRTIKLAMWDVFPAVGENHAACWWKRADERAGPPSQVGAGAPEIY